MGTAAPRFKVIGYFRSGPSILATGFRSHASAQDWVRRQRKPSPDSTKIYNGNVAVDWQIIGYFGSAETDAPLPPGFDGF